MALTFVEGDNLDVMRGLADATFDLVYLDPPYNTGNDFAYRDRRSHDEWVSMMRPRLDEVRRLLRPGGVVCCSIDDHEVARLRLLLDEVMGEEQFLAQVVVNLNAKGRQLGRGFATSHEYLLVHARSLRYCLLDASSAEHVDDADFPLVDGQGRRFRHLPLRNTNKKLNPATARTLHYPLYGDPESGAVRTEAFERAQEIWPVFGDGTPAVWRWSPSLVAERPDDLVCRRIRGRLGERADVFQRDWRHREGGRRKKLRTIWPAREIGSTDTAVAELKALVGPVFESPKPTGLLLRVLEMLPPDVAVLDPFAGSGTTGHAVAMANATDNGTRTCVLVESGEPVRPGSRAAAAGFGTVADVTRARLRAVAAAYSCGLVEQ